MSKTDVMYILNMSSFFC